MKVLRPRTRMCGGMDLPGSRNAIFPILLSASSGVIAFSLPGLLDSGGVERAVSESAWASPFFSRALRFDRVASARSQCDGKGPGEDEPFLARSVCDRRSRPMAPRFCHRGRPRGYILTGRRFVCRWLAAALERRTMWRPRMSAKTGSRRQDSVASFPAERLESCTSSRLSFGFDGNPHHHLCRHLSGLLWMIVKCQFHPKPKQENSHDDGEQFRIGPTGSFHNPSLSGGMLESISRIPYTIIAIVCKFITIYLWKNLTLRKSKGERLMLLK